MSNPYQTPKPQQPFQSPANEVNGPAIALMVVSIIAIVLGILGLIGDAFILVMGAANQMNGDFRIIVRMVWGIVLIGASVYVLYGSMQMKNLTNYGTAKAAAIVAMIPCIGPCCILGIPFGIWAFVVLNKPHIQSAFRS